ncbi:MAG: DUF3237 domain-containing protein [Rubrivivax sp.]|jgi:hypothetical protein|nr:DUF3237 domain-containing protein [Rubrivivax sp.]
MNSAPPPLEFLAQVRCEVGALVNLGTGPYGERRCVPLLGGSVSGPGLNGAILPGGADWQILRADGALDIQAHYIVRTIDGALIEIDSRGLRHGPPAVMQRLARGEAVAPAEYFFRTLMRFQTGHPAWLHLNATMALARGERQAQLVVLDVFRIG